MQLGRHPNLLRLLGCVLDEDKDTDQLIITEFAPFGALDGFIDCEDGIGANMSEVHEIVILQQVG